MTQPKIHAKAEECGHLLIPPDPGCPECTKIMVWRSAHRGIVITDGAEIRLSDARWGNRHLHIRDVRVAHLEVERQRKERGAKERFHPEA